MEGVFRSTRDAPPSHYRFKIENFSLLSSSSLERYESCEFDGGNYKWRLVLYPNGDVERDGEDHISFYLALADKSCLDLNKEIQVIFSLFVFDHIRDKYLYVQQLSRFHAMKSESGFNKFLSHKLFNDPSNGYLINDTCMFGAEVFVINSSTTKGHCLSLMAVKPEPFKFTWKIRNFSELEDTDYYSDKFTTGGHDWKIEFHSKGYDTGKGNCLSMYLHLDDETHSTGDSVAVEYKLRIVDQVNQDHKELGLTKLFIKPNSGWGWHCFLKLSELNKSTGYLVKDVCILEAEVIVLGSAKKWE